MNNKIGRVLKRTAYVFYTLGVFFLIFGMLLSSVTQPAKASSGQPAVNPQATDEWDKSSITVSGGSCDGNCTYVKATVCNYSGNDMDGTSEWYLWFSATSNPMHDTARELITSGNFQLANGQCTEISFDPDDSKAGNYKYQFMQRPGHGNDYETRDDAWAETCSIGNCPVKTDTPTTPPPAYITVTKTVVGITTVLPSVFSFTRQVSGIGTDTYPFEADGTNNFTLYPPTEGWTWSVSEVTPSTEYTVGTSGTCSGMIKPGDSFTCNITNTYTPPATTETPVVHDPAHLTIIKHVINDNGGTLSAENFMLTLTSSEHTETFAGSEAGRGYDFHPGGDSISFDVTEVENPGYTATYDGCSGTLEDGENLTCTITNDDKPASLTVIKQVVNNNTGTKGPGDFMMNVTVNGQTQSFAGVGGAGKTITVNAGPYSVNENDPTELGYTGSIGNTCSGTLIPGGSATCVIVNDDIPPVLPPGTVNLTVIKVVVNGEHGTAVVADFPLFVNQTPVYSEVTIPLTPGSYVVSETNREDYIGVFSEDCNENGVVVLADDSENDDKTCIITNTYIETHQETPTPTDTDEPDPEETQVPAPQSTPSQGQALIPVTGADMSHSASLPTTALPRLALNLGIAMFGLAMVFHGASNRMGKKK